jgi:enoyl-CoA hydratase/carnithine racemase
VDGIGDRAARFAAACGRANALRYLLSPDPWGAAEAWRMGEVQDIAPDPKTALDAGLRLAQSAARCAPQSVRAMLSATRASCALV